MDSLINPPAIDKSGTAIRRTRQANCRRFPIQTQCAEGIDYITVHCGVTRGAVARTHAEDRVAGIVSRGGALLAAWMDRNGRENPLLEDYDALLDIAFRYDVTLSLGDGLRPGAVSDATDAAQIEELLVIDKLK